LDDTAACNRKGTLNPDTSPGCGALAKWDYLQWFGGRQHRLGQAAVTDDCQHSHRDDKSCNARRQSRLATINIQSIEWHDLPTATAEMSSTWAAWCRFWAGSRPASARPSSEWRTRHGHSQRGRHRQRSPETALLSAATLTGRNGRRHYVQWSQRSLSIGWRQ